jgi:ATP-dependent helicase/DNAse subunit B
MVERVTVFAGPARSGKTTRLLADYRQRLGGDALGGCLWLCPTSRAATASAGQLLDRSLRGCLSPNLLTFHQLAARILAAAARRMRPLTPGQGRSVLSRLIADNHRDGRLRYFAPISSTPGFLDLVVGFVRELKRVEIWPDELANALGPRPDAKNRELLSLYRQYQDYLEKHDLYDGEGQFWAARELLRDGRCGPLADVRHVYVDGFADFTRTEYDVLELLGGHAQTLSISLPLEADTQRGDLFTKPTRTLEELRRRLPSLTVQYLPRAGGTCAALDHLERYLFANPGDTRPATDTAGLEIVAAAGATQEIELIAERIKGLLTGGPDRPGVAAQDILVVFRTLADAAPLVGEIFEQFGIPHAIAAAPALDAAPIGRALLGWLRLAAEDWPFRRVLAILAHNYFQPDWPEWQQGRAAVALARLVRELELPSGRAELVQRIERLAARAGEEAGLKKRVSQRLLDAQLAAPLVRRMAAALDGLPDRAGPGAWSSALVRLAREVGLLDAAQGSPLAPAAAALDQVAWQRMTEALAQYERLARWTGDAAPQWSLAQFVAALEDLLRSEELPLVRDETGRVRVLSAEAARNLAAPYVFVAGLAEKSFPLPHRDDCIHSDAERRQLAEANLPLASHALDSRFEMLLFYEVVTRATRELVLSYAALDPAAQPLAPSPYVSEVERACGAGRIRRNAQPALPSVPPGDDVRRVRDFRVRAVSRALVGEAALLGEFCAHPLTRPMAGNLLAALRVAQARGGDAFGPYEGLLESDAVRQKLAERFGPRRAWSPSQLEQYAYCPFQFYMHTVLHAAPPNELELGVDYMERGRLLHSVLSATHRRLNQLAGGPSSPGAHRREPFLELVRKLAGETLERHGDHGLQSGLLEIDVRQVLEWLTEYFGQHSEYDREWTSFTLPPRPAHFEVSFGPRHRGDEAAEEQVLDDDADPELSRIDPFKLDCGGEAIQFAGRIDRIDVGEVAGQMVFNIVDYKSGAGSKRTSLQWVREGRALQLPLYALAAEWLLAERGLAPYRAAYWHVSGSGYQEKESVKFRAVLKRGLAADPEWTTLEPQLRERVGSLVASIRDGQFPMHSADDKCTGLCPYRTVCRVNQVRALGKTWPPPGEDEP